MDQLPKDHQPEFTRPTLQTENSETPQELGALFYRQIAPTETLPPWRRVPHPIDARTIGMNALSLAHGTLDLRGHRLFIFNALMYLRYQHARSKSPIARRGLAASTIRELGFTGSRTTAWRDNIQTLAKELNTAAGEEILFITGESRGTRYAINERFRLLEQDTDPEAAVWYEFAQALSTGLPHVPHAIEFGPQDSPLLDLVIRENDTIVCNSVGIQLNQHELMLLGLLLLQQGDYLANEEIKALGFHAYARSEAGKAKALERAIKTLNEKIPSTVPFIISEKTGRNSINTIGPRVHVTDIRHDTTPETSFAAMGTIMTILFDRLQDSPFAPPEERLSHDQIKALFPNYLDSLTTLQAYTLCLKYKVLLTPLIGTEITHRNGSVTRYEDLIEHILSETPNTRTRISQLLGVSNGSSRAISAITNLHKAIRGSNPSV